MLSRDDTRFGRACASYERALRGCEYEVIRIPDARGMCEGLNRGTAQARGGRLILSHDDVEILCDEFPEKLQRRFERFDLFGFCGTTRLIGPSWHLAGPPWIYGQVLEYHRFGAGSPVELTVVSNGAPARTIPHVQAIDGALMAGHRPVFERFPFDQQTFGGWHMYDVDFSYRVHLAGLKVAIACDLDIFHYAPRDVDPFQTREWQLAAQTFYDKHKATLPPLPDDWVKFKHTMVRVTSPDEGVRVMRAPYFDGLNRDE